MIAVSLKERADYSRKVLVWLNPPNEVVAEMEKVDKQPTPNK